MYHSSSPSSRYFPGKLLLLFSLRTCFFPFSFLPFPLLYHTLNPHIQCLLTRFLQLFYSLIRFHPEVTLNELFIPSKCTKRFPSLFVPAGALFPSCRYDPNSLKHNPCARFRNRMIAAIPSTKVRTSRLSSSASSQTRSGPK